jgi:hypothetical protein
MKNFFNYKTVTNEHLSLLEKELNEAGSFNEFMFRKNAFVRKNESIMIVIYNNVEEYKEKFLTGEYKSLHHIYNTKVPYTFWSKLYIELRRRKTTDISSI